MSVFLKNQNWNFDSWNNGLSLVALSLSIILLPSARIKKEIEQKEIDDLNEEISKRDSRITQIEKERDDHIFRIEKERDSRISRVEKERDDHVSKIENDYDKIINNLKQKRINDLLTANEQSRIDRDLLREKIDNLNEKNRNLRKINSELREKINRDSDQIIHTKRYPLMVSQSDPSESKSSTKSSVPEKYSVVKDFSELSSISDLIKPLGIVAQQIEFPKPTDYTSLISQIEFPKPTDYTPLTNQIEFPKPIDYTSSISQIEFPKPIDYTPLQISPKTLDFAKSILPGESNRLNKVEKND